MGLPLVAGLILAQGTTPRLSAQTASPLPTTDTPTRGSLLQPSDIALGALFVGSLLSIDPLEPFDEGFSRGLVSADLSEHNTFVRSAGRAMGDLRYDLALTGGVFVVGAVTGQSRVQEIGLHSLESLVTAAAITQTFKFGLGRARPEISPSDSDEFDPFSVDRQFNSFPSGHTAQTFAIATTLSYELRDDAPWLPYVVYPLATWTATSRVLDRKHWVTDLLGGAAVGIFSARLVRRLNHGVRPAEAIAWHIIPGPDGGLGVGLSVAAP